MRKTHLLLAALMAFTLSGLPALAQDGDPVALVVAIRGKAEAIDARGNTRGLVMKSPVYRSDTIKTGPQGRIQVLFTDNTIVSLGRASEMVVVEHVWNAENKSGAMKTRVKEGVFRIMGGAIAKEAPHSFITVTPAATIGIRGSMYAGRVDGGRLTVVFEGGRGIDVANEVGAVSITRPGFGTSIPAAGMPPQRPKRFSAQDLSDLNRDLALDEQESENQATPPEQEDGQDQQDQEEADQESSGEGQQDASGDETDDSAGDGDAQEPESADSQDTDDEPADTGNERADTEDEGTVTGVETAETGKETTDSGIQTTAAGGEESTLSGDATLEVSDSGETLALTSTGMSDETVISTSTTLLQTSESFTSATTINSALTEVTQTWQEPFTNSDTSQLPLANSIALTGFHMSTLVDAGDYLNTNNSYQYDTDMQATSSSGLVNEVPAAQSGTFADLSFSMEPYDPLAAYSYPEGSATFSTRTISLLDAQRSFSLKASSDAKGEFVIFGAEGSFTQGQTYLYRELGFLGAACTATLPTDGLSGYFGPALGFEDLDVRRDFGYAELFTEVNWYNRKAFGRMIFSDTNDPAVQDPDSSLYNREGGLFFFADVDPDNRCLTNVRIFGPRGGNPEDPVTDPVAWIEGTGDGLFSGSNYQGFGLTGVGYDYDISTGMADNTTAIGTSRLVAAGFREIEPGIDETSPRGTRDFYGFVVGIAEDMNVPETNRRIYMNDDPDTFQLILNQDAGTVGGTISAVDIISPTERHLDYIEIGSSHGSAYILEDNFVTLLGDTGSDCVTNSMETGGLKPRANYLVTEDPDYQMSDYFTWGYWEIAYTDPMSGADYHVHSPGSVWIAGELTPSTALQDLAASEFVGEYTGNARGVKIDTASALTRLHNGITNIQVEFSPASINPVSGSINFDEVQLDLENGSISPTEATLSANINGMAASMVQGAFFGPSADAVGGNFHAREMDGTRYIGVFGGNR